MNNYLTVEMAATAENVSLARIIVAGFIAPLDPTVDEIADIKTAVSEAVTNAIIHGYCGNDSDNTNSVVKMRLTYYGRKITVEVSDMGIGIEDIDSAREPMFTTKPDLERSGLGFTVMETFMDSVHITSEMGAGTTVLLTKTLGDTAV